MACGWLYNPGNPHAADARRTAQGQVPKYYRLTTGPFSVAIHPLEPGNLVHFGPQDAILKKVSDEFPLAARQVGIAGFPEWWQCPLGRQKQIDFAPDTIENWEAANPGEDWQDFFPRAQWWLRPGLPSPDGFRWVVIANFWTDPGYIIPWVVAGGGVVDVDFPWLTNLWSPFGRNELLSSTNPAEGPRVWVEDYWP